MKQREINMILSNNAATSDHGESFINLKILDVGKCVYTSYIYIILYLSIGLCIQSFNSINCNILASDLPEIQGELVYALH